MDHCNNTALEQQQKEAVCLLAYSSSAVASSQALIWPYQYSIGGTMHVTAGMS